MLGTRCSVAYEVAIKVRYVRPDEGMERVAASQRERALVHGIEDRGDRPKVARMRAPDPVWVGRVDGRSSCVDSGNGDYLVCHHVGTGLDLDRSVPWDCSM